MTSVVVLMLALGVAEPVVKALESRYNRLETLKADFIQIYKSDAQAPARQEVGTLYLKKPGKMRWEYSRPEVKLFLSDGKTIFFYVPEDAQVTRMAAKESGDLRMPLRFLLGRMNLKREFRVSPAADTAPLEPGNSVLLLRPKRADDRVRDLLLETDGQSRIRRLKITENDGAVTEFRLLGEVVNPPLDNSMFQFRIPPGVEVVDQK